MQEHAHIQQPTHPLYPSPMSTGQPHPPSPTCVHTLNGQLYPRPDLQKYIVVSYDELRKPAATVNFKEGQYVPMPLRLAVLASCINNLKGMIRKALFNNGMDMFNLNVS